MGEIIEFRRRSRPGRQPPLKIENLAAEILRTLDCPDSLQAIRDLLLSTTRDDRIKRNIEAHMSRLAKLLVDAVASSEDACQRQRLAHWAAQEAANRVAVETGWIDQQEQQESIRSTIQDAALEQIFVGNEPWNLILLSPFCDNGLDPRWIENTMDQGTGQSPGHHPCQRYRLPAGLVP